MLKSELDLDDPELTPELAGAQVVDYIDNFYNSERRHSTLGYFSPIEYKLKHIVLQQGHLTYVSRKTGQSQSWQGDDYVHSS
jgi:hypothetical protein